MTHMLKLVLAQFHEETFTIELRPGEAPLENLCAGTLQRLVNEGYISRHPGILGSRTSYYRTAKGMAAWKELYQ